MATVMKLDANAVRELIKDDEFKLELQRAVVAEIVRGMFKNDLPGTIVDVINANYKAEATNLVKAIQETDFLQKTLTEELKKIVTYVRSRPSDWYSTPVLTEGVKTSIRNEIETILSAEVAKGIEGYRVTIEERMARAERAILNHIGNLQINVDKEVREQITAEVRAKILEGLGG